jgi:sugar lactone lactonase YvrE
MASFPPRIRFAGILSIAFAFAAAVSGCGDVIVEKAESVGALAGADGGPGFFDGSPTTPVRFASPSGVAVTTTGDRFVADRENHVIRKIDASGNVTSFAGLFGRTGSTDGTGSAARFNLPGGITAVGTTLFVCDTGNHTIRRISASGVVTTLAGTPGTSGAIDNAAGAGNVLFSSPRGITSDGATLGTTLFVADTGNHNIRRLFLSGATTTIAGSGLSGADDGVGVAASFSSPGGITFDGASLFVADTGNHTIREITSPFGASGNVTTLAGGAGVPGFVDNTTGVFARFSSPASITALGSGGSLIVADTGNHVVRQIDATGFVTTLAGGPQIPGFADNPGALARFDSPEGIGSDGLSPPSLLVADTGNHVIRRVTLGGDVTTEAGNPPRVGSADGTGAAARFAGPAGVAVVGDNVFVADTENHMIRRITSTGAVTTLAGAAGAEGSADGTGSAARFRFPGGIASLGGDLFVSDSENHTIRKVTTSGVVTTLAGNPGATGSADGTGTAARFNNPQGVVALGGDLYVADSGNHTIRKVTTSGAVTTLAGSPGVPGSDDGTGSLARFRSSLGITAVGTDLFVADTGNHTIRRITTPAGTVDTFAGFASQSGIVDGQGDNARFSSPDGISGVGSVLFVADRGNHVVRRISTTRRVTTFVGNPDAATTREGSASSALLNAPAGIAGVDGTIYFTDINENVVRKILF